MYKISIIVLMDKLNRDKVKMINSIENQTLKDIEVLCVTSESENLENHKNIQIVENFGEAIERASGEYTAITTSNTFFEQNWAEKVYDYAKIDNEDMIICDLEIQDYEENKLKSYSFENIEKDINRLIVLNWNLCNLLFKTNKIKDIKLKVNNKYGELLYILEALIKCEKIGYAQDIKCYLYVRKADLENIELKNVEELKEVLKETKELYKAKNKYNEQYKNILSAIAFIALGVNTIIKLKENQAELEIDLKEKIRNIINYLDINFFEWRNNPILRSSFIKKEFPYVWYANKMYKYGYIELYLTLYKMLYSK